MPKSLDREWDYFVEDQIALDKQKADARRKYSFPLPSIHPWIHSLTFSYRSLQCLVDVFHQILDVFYAD